MMRDMLGQLYEYTKNHWIVYFKWVNFKLYKLYLNKTLKKKEGKMGLQKVSSSFII